MPKRLKKLSEEVLCENHWFLYKHDVYEKPDGTPGDYFYSESLGMVKVIPFFPDGRLVLILQHRYLQDKQSIEFPAGGIDDGETPSESAIRELREETGYGADELIKIGTFEPSNGISKNEAHVFIARIFDAQGEQELEQTEEIEVLIRRPDELEEMIARGDIWDGPTIVAWMLSRKKILSIVSEV